MRASKTYSEQEARKRQGTVFKIWAVAFCFMLAGSVHAQNWTQLGKKLTGLDVEDHFGTVVSMSNDGNTIAIGAPSMSVDNPNEQSLKNGEVRVYKWNGKIWRMKGEPITGMGPSDGFGHAIHLNGDGNMIVIGAPFYDNIIGDDIGMATVYQFISGKWIQISPVFKGHVPGQHFGYSVAINDVGDVIGVGAPSGDLCCEAIGHVKIYKRRALVVTNPVSFSPLELKKYDDQLEHWTQVGQTLWGDGQIDRFGSSIDLNANGKVLAVGAPGKSLNGHYSGEVKVYVWRGEKWVTMGSSIFGEFSGESVGQRIDLSDDGSTLAIGVPHYTGAYYHGGEVRVYRFDSQNWIKKGMSLRGDTEYDYFGYSVSLSYNGDFLVISAPYLHPTFIYGAQAIPVKNPSGQDNLSRAYVRAFKWELPGDHWTGKNNPEYHFVYSGDWVATGDKLYPQTATDLFGSSIAVAASSQKVVIGTCRASNDEEPCAGYVQVYKLSTKSTFSQVGVIQDDTHVPYEVETTLPTPIMKSVYPNPTTGTVTVELKQTNRSGQLSVYHISGNQVLNQGFGSSDRINLEIPGKPGVYYVEIIALDGTRELVRVVKR